MKCMTNMHDLSDVTIETPARKRTVLSMIAIVLFFSLFDSAQIISVMILIVVRVAQLLERSRAQSFPYPPWPSHPVNSSPTLELHQNAPTRDSLRMLVASLKPKA